MVRGSQEMGGEAGDGEGSGDPEKGEEGTKEEVID